MSVLLNLSYAFNAIPTRIPTSYFVNIHKLTVNYIWRDEGSRIINIISKEKNKVLDWPYPTSRLNIKLIAAAAAKLLQSCPSLCDPIDSSPPGSSAPEIFQARTLEWVAISFSNAWKWKVKVKLLSRVWLFGTPWTAAYQAPLPMGFSRQEYWSGLPLVYVYPKYELLMENKQCAQAA